MIARKSLRLIAGLLLAVFTTAPAGAADPGATTGSWTIRPSETPDQVQLTFIYGRSVHSTDWPVSALTGLRLSPAERHDVGFVIERDAGRIDAEGAATAGTAAGGFRFTPEPGYAGDLRKLGLGEIKPDAQLAFALQDVSLDYVHALAALGVGRLSVDVLLAFRIHGVTPDYVAAIEKLGYDHPPSDQLIAMRINGVTPDYIAAVKAKGVRDTSLAQLVAMKIQGID